MKMLGYNTISRVMETWETCRRRTTDFENVLGTLILQNLFELHPPTRAVFGFTDIDEVSESPQTTMHARTVVSMFNSVLQMLGPDADLVEEILSQVGQRHKDFGVTPEFFPFMGIALIQALESTLGPTAFTQEHHKAWVEVYKELSAEIVKSM